MTDHNDYPEDHNDQKQQIIELSTCHITSHDSDILKTLAVLEQEGKQHDCCFAVVDYKEGYFKKRFNI